MSEASSPRAWRFYLDDMIGFCERVQSFTNGFTQGDFIQDRMRFDATVRNMELIGEAATHVPEVVRASAPEVPWRLVVATGTG